MNAHRHSLREMHGGDRLQARGVHDQQLTLTTSSVIPVAHQNPVIFGNSVGPVLGTTVGNLLVALGDSPERLMESLTASGWRRYEKAPGFLRGPLAIRETT
jgi:hypothetical protein